MKDFNRQIARKLEHVISHIRNQIGIRSVKASNELKNSVRFILYGRRHGRRYKNPSTGKMYTASAPGEAPANRTGTLRLSYHSKTYAQRNGNNYEFHAVADSNYRVRDRLLGQMLEQGTAKIRPRPFREAAIRRALPKVIEIYNRDYFN